MTAWLVRHRTTPWCLDWVTVENVRLWVRGAGRGCAAHQLARAHALVASTENVGDGKPYRGHDDAEDRQPGDTVRQYQRADPGGTHIAEAVDHGIDHVLGLVLAFMVHDGEKHFARRLGDRIFGHASDHLDACQYHHHRGERHGQEGDHH